MFGKASDADHTRVLGTSFHFAPHPPGVRPLISNDSGSGQAEKSREPRSSVREPRSPAISSSREPAQAVGLGQDLVEAGRAFGGGVFAANLGQGAGVVLLRFLRPGLSAELQLEGLLAFLDRRRVGR